MIKEASLNIFGTRLSPCSSKPLTGFYRDACCNTGPEDRGLHVVCVILSDEFLQFSFQTGNDLITPRPEYQFPGLKAGDRWCLCALRWKDALEAGVAPLVVLEATHEKALEVLNRDDLITHAYRENRIV